LAREIRADIRKLAKLPEPRCANTVEEVMEVLRCSVSPVPDEMLAGDGDEVEETLQEDVVLTRD
jgi:hypothetical protein